MMKPSIFAPLFTTGILAILLVSCSRDPNVRKQKYYESGQRYFAKGKYQEALIQFSNAVQVDPRYADAHYELAQVYMKSQQWTPAYQELERAVELQPDNSRARLDLANLLIAAHEFGLAKEQTDLLVQQRPNDPLVHVALGNLSLAENNLSGAMQEMQKAVDLDPSRSDSYMALASLQMKTGQPDSAEPNFKKAVDLAPNKTRTRLALAEYYGFRHSFDNAEQQIRAAIAANPQDTDAPAALVRLYMAQGKKNDAESYLRQVRHDFPHNSVGYRMLGDFYFAIGDLDHALAEYSSLYQEHSGDILVKKNYVQLLILKNRIDEATKLDDEILKSSPNDGVALTSRGQILIQNGKYKEAVEVLQSALRSDPDNSTSYYQLGVAFDRLGNLGQAQNAWNNATQRNPDFGEAHLALANCALRQGDMPALEHSASQVIRLLPSSPAGYAMRAVSFLKRGELNRAEEDANKAITIAPQAADGYMQLANIRQAQKNYPDAAKLYMQTLERDPGSIDALASLVNTYVAQGQTGKALSAVQTQIARVPQRSAFYDLLGTLQFDHRKTQSDLEVAESNLKTATDLDHNNADAWLKLGQVQAARGEIDDAIATSQRAVAENPKQLEFYLLTGRLYEAKHDLAKARECYQKALDIEPSSPQASNNMASLLTKTGGNLDIALSLAQNARRQMPNSANVADTLGWVLYQKGAYRSAIDSFREALQLNDKGNARENPSLHLHLALAYQRNGQPNLARQHLEQALKLDPSYAAAEDVKRLLNELRG